MSHKHSYLRKGLTVCHCMLGPKIRACKGHEDMSLQEQTASYEPSASSFPWLISAAEAKIPLTWLSIMTCRDGGLLISQQQVKFNRVYGCVDISRSSITNKASLHEIWT